LKAKAMKTSGEFRLAADNCRLLARNMGDPDHARKLNQLSSEFDAMAEAEDAIGCVANVDGLKPTA